MKLDTYVAARFVRSDAAELIADGTDWLLTPGTVDGVCKPVLDLYTEDIATGDGAVVTGKRVAARDLTMTGTAMNIANSAVLRARACAFFNPKYTFRIYLTYLGRTRWIQAELAGADIPTGTVCSPQTFTVTFLAAEPYWQSVDDFGQDIAAETPRWGFPYMDHPTRGVLVSVYNFEREVVFEYDGDVPAFPTIVLTADGDVTNPKIVKDGAFVRLIDTLAAGDTVVVTTAPRAVGVTKNGANVLNKIDRASDFSGLQMLPGPNRVRYEADYGDNRLHAVIRYNKQYLGV